MKYFVSLAYNGTKYHGWQQQINADSVQETLEKHMSIKLKEPIKLTGAGRTDTGVHASYFVASFEAKNNNLNNKEIIHQLNRFLPPDISIFQIVKVIPKANARFDAISRTYHYFFTTYKNAFLMPYTYHVYFPVNLDKMNETLEYLKGEHNFEAFSKKDKTAKTSICNVMETLCNPTDYGFYIKIKANRFLRNMVRAIVGTVLEMEKQQLHPNHIMEILNSQDRAKAGSSAPAQGLFLTNIEYPNNIFVEEKLLPPQKHFLVL